MTVLDPQAALVVRRKTQSRENTPEPAVGQVDPKMPQVVECGELSFSWSPGPGDSLILFWVGNEGVADKAGPSSGPTHTKKK